jgi:hypothetical protein
MQHRDEHETDPGYPERVEGIVKDLDHLAEVLFSMGEDSGARNVRLALAYLKESRAAMTQIRLPKR